MPAKEAILAGKQQAGRVVREGKFAHTHVGPHSVTCPPLTIFFLHLQVVVSDRAAGKDLVPEPKN